MSDLKEQAEVLKAGLLAGYVQPAEVIAWADQVIAAGDVPGPEFIEVSLGGMLPADELARALNAIRGDVCATRLARMIIRQMAAALRRDPETGPGIARWLNQLWLDKLAPSHEAMAQMSRFDDSYDLAESGAWGTLPDVQAVLAEFLSAWAE